MYNNKFYLSRDNNIEKENLEKEPKGYLLKDYSITKRLKSTVKGAAIDIYFYIKGMSKKYGYCFATSKKIAYDLSIPESTVNRCLGKLKKENFIDIEHYEWKDRYGSKHFQRRIRLRELVCVEGGLGNNITEEEVIEEAKAAKENITNEKIDSLDSLERSYELKNIKSFEIHNNWDYIKHKNKKYKKQNNSSERIYDSSERSCDWYNRSGDSSERIYDSSERSSESHQEPFSIVPTNFGEEKEAQDIYKNKTSTDLIEKLKNNFGETIYNAWLSDITFSVENGTVNMECANKFVLDTVKRDYFKSVYKNGKLFRKGIEDLLLN